MSANNERPRLTLGQEILRFVKNPRLCWNDATDEVKRGYLVLVAVFGWLCGLITVIYSEWLSGRVACATQPYVDQSIRTFSIAGSMLMFLFSVFTLFALTLNSAPQAKELSSTAPPVLKNHRWIWSTLIVFALIAICIILYKILHMCW